MEQPKKLPDIYIPDIYIIDNGWVKYMSEEDYPDIKRHYDPNQKSYHGDATVDIIRQSKIPFDKIHLVNVYENSYITGEPKVEKQASLRRVLQLAKAGDIMLMNMELYRTPYNLPITADPASVEIVNELAKKGVICIFPAGNSCIDLADKIENPTNYLLVGAKNFLKDEVGNNIKDGNGKDKLIHTSNFTTKGNMIYKALCDDCSEYFGLTQSSAAAAIVAKEIINFDRSNLKDNQDNTEILTILLKKFRNTKGRTNPNKSNIKPIDKTNYKGTEFDITSFMLEKWRKELSISYNTENSEKDKKNIEALANLLNPINRNLFPYPVKLKVFENDKNVNFINFPRKFEQSILEKVVEEFKKDYLALKLCFGIDSNGNIIIIASGYIPKGFKSEKETTTFFDVSKVAYSLYYEELPNSKGSDLDAYLITPTKRQFYIKEFQSYFKKTNTYGLTIGLEVLDGLLKHYYKGDKLQFMVVSDSRNMNSEQEFGILITNGDNEKPICIIKDRVINQADGPSCPPVPPCNQ